MWKLLRANHRATFEWKFKQILSFCSQYRNEIIFLFVIVHGAYVSYKLKWFSRWLQKKNKNYSKERFNFIHQYQFKQKLVACISIHWKLIKRILSQLFNRLILCDPLNWQIETQINIYIFQKKRKKISPIFFHCKTRLVITEKKRWSRVQIEFMMWVEQKFKIKTRVHLET